MEFSMTVASAMIVFIALLFVMGGMKDALEESSMRVSAVAIGQRVAAAVDAMFRDACGVSCSTTVTLPDKIDAFGTSADYNVTFSDTQVLVNYGKEGIVVESGRPVGSLMMEQKKLPGGTVISIAYAGG